MTRNFRYTVLLTILFFSVWNIQCIAQNNWDLELSKSISPDTLCPYSLDSLVVSVNNVGTNPVDSFYLNWTVNGQPNAKWVYQFLDGVNGSLPSSASVYIDTVFRDTGTVNIWVQLSLPNNNVDQNLSNNLQSHVIPALEVMNVQIIDSLSCTFYSGAKMQVNIDNLLPNTQILWSNGYTSFAFWHFMVNLNIAYPSVIVTDSFGCEYYDTATIVKPYSPNLMDSVSICSGDTLALSVPNQIGIEWSTGSSDSTIFVQDSGWYAVKVGTSWCYLEDSILVKENLSKPVVYFEDSTNYQTVVFTNFTTESDSFLWDFGDGTTGFDKHPTHVYPWSPDSNTCYLVTLIAFNSCGMDTLQQAIRVGAWPGVVGASPFLVTQTSDPWTLEFGAANISIDLWEFGDGNTSSKNNPIHTYVSNNTYECYTVKRQEPFSCGVNHRWKKVAVGNYPLSDPCGVSFATSISKIIVDDLNIYPNPAKDHIVIQLPKQGSFTAEFINVNGTQLFSVQLNGQGNKVIDTSNLIPGVFIMNLISGNEEWVGRLIITD